MDSLHNFPSDLKSYLEKRKISFGFFTHLIELGLINVKEHSFLIAMKDISGEIVGWQERFYEPITYQGKICKSKAIFESQIGYFFTEIDFSKPVIILEGEIDRLSISNISNIVGLQGVNNLRKLVDALKIKGVNEIYLLIDNDEAADSSISKLLDLDISSLASIFDCREILGSHKDLNEYIISGCEINMEHLKGYKKSLKDFKLLINKLVTSNKRVDHSQFAKYIVEKLNIASVDGNIFMYNFASNNGIWKTLSKHQFEHIIMDQLECLLGGIIPIFTNTDKNNIHDFVAVYAENQILRDRLLFKGDLEVNLKNCILTPQTLQTRQYTKTDYKFQKFPYEYTIFASYKEPLLRLNFLNEILEGYEDKQNIIDFLQEFFGSLLMADTKYQKALLCYGSGANGKGVMLSIIRELLGSNNVSNIGLHEINNSQNIYNLFGKLANMDSDMQQDVQLDSGIIKKIISGEPIVAKVLYRQPIEYVPFVRLLIACNEQPYLKTIDNSIRRRFIYLHLKNSFYGREDPDLIKKLSAEIENIFARSVKGLSRLLSRGEFIIPKELTDNLDNFIKENDTVELFLDEGIVEKNDKEKIYNKDIYPLYRWFCNDCGYKPLSQKNFNKRLRDKGFEDFRESIGRGFLGLCKNQPF